MKGKDAQDVVISRGALDGGVSLLGSGSRRYAKLRRLPVGQRPRQGGDGRRRTARSDPEVGGGGIKEPPVRPPPGFSPRRRTGGVSPPVTPAPLPQTTNAGRYHVDPRPLDPRLWCYSRRSLWFTQLHWFVVVSSPVFLHPQSLRSKKRRSRSPGHARIEYYGRGHNPDSTYPQT